MIDENDHSTQEADPPAIDVLPKSPPKQPVWLKWLLGLSVVALLAIFCLSITLYFTLIQFKDNIVTAIAGEDTVTEAAVPHNQIAFIGNDNNIWLVSPSGENLQPLTQNATDGLGYSIPTWSPDNRYVAYTGPGQNRGIALYASSSVSEPGDPTVLYSAPDSAPFYLYWAPDGQTVTFLTQEASSLSMRLARLDRDRAGQTDREQIIKRGAPLYWAWSPNGDQFFLHVGGARINSDQAHMSLWDNQARAKEVELNLAPGQFQAPVWSIDGHYIFYVAQTESGDEAIYRIAADTLKQEVVTTLRGLGRTFMVLSPDGRYLAFLETDLERPVPVGTPHIIDLKTFETKLLTQRPVLSMYWSPDGRKLALLTVGLNESGPSTKAPGLAAPLPQDVRFSWWAYETDSEALNSLVTVNPSAEFLQTIPYFDQYHLSMTIWSPDSRYLVVTSRQDDSEDGSVLVVDSAGQEDPRHIGEGKMAVWSWK